jgi:hypothetical protein
MPQCTFVDKTGKRKLCAFGQKGTTMFRWRRARTVLVYLVMKYLRWKLRRILRQLDEAEAEATSRTCV